MRSFIPTYNTMYNTPVVRQFVKREAEAEADPAFVSGLPVTTYTGFPVSGYTGLPVTGFTGLHASSVQPVTSYSVSPVNAVPVNHVAVPVNTHSVTSYSNPNHYTAVSNGVYGPKTIAKNYGVTHITKREAEADPALYSTIGGVHTAVPMYYSNVANVANVAHVANVANVAVPAIGYTHSSNLGVCTNYLGLQVPC